MKQFTINVHFDMVVQEIVIAEDLDSARNIALMNACRRELESESECVGTDSCLVEENDFDLTALDCVTFFQIFKDLDGVKNIKFLGYFYKSEINWQHVEFSGFQMPLNVYLANKNKYDQWEESVKQYITEMTLEQVIESINNYAAKPIGNFKIDLNENTPEGIYY